MYAVGRSGSCVPTRFYFQIFVPAGILLFLYLIWVNMQLQQLIASEGIGSKNREAVAAACLEYRSAKVRTLWRAEGEKARAKILTFMRNHKVP